MRGCLLGPFSSKRCLLSSLPYSSHRVSRGILSGVAGRAWVQDGGSAKARGHTVDRWLGCIRHRWNKGLLRMEPKPVESAAICVDAKRRKTERHRWRLRVQWME